MNNSLKIFNSRNNSFKKFLLLSLVFNQIFHKRFQAIIISVVIPTRKVNAPSSQMDRILKNDSIITAIETKLGSPRRDLTSKESPGRDPTPKGTRDMTPKGFAPAVSSPKVNVFYFSLNKLITSVVIGNINRTIYQFRNLQPKWAQLYQLILLGKQRKQPARLTARLSLLGLLPHRPLESQTTLLFPLLPLSRQPLLPIPSQVQLPSYRLPPK